MLPKEQGKKFLKLAFQLSLCWSSVGTSNTLLSGRFLRIRRELFEFFEWAKGLQTIRSKELSGELRISTSKSELLEVRTSKVFGLSSSDSELWKGTLFGRRFSCNTSYWRARHFRVAGHHCSPKSAGSQWKLLIEILNLRTFESELLNRIFLKCHSLRMITIRRHRVAFHWNDFSLQLTGTILKWKISRFHRRSSAISVHAKRYSVNSYSPRWVFYWRESPVERISTRL